MHPRMHLNSQKLSRAIVQSIGKSPKARILTASLLCSFPNIEIIGILIGAALQWTKCMLWLGDLRESLTMVKFTIPVFGISSKLRSE